MADLNTIAPTAQESAALALTQAQSAALLLAPFRVTDAATAATAVEMARSVREHRTRLEAERDSVAKPLRGLATKISGWFKAPIDQLLACEQHLRTEIAGYQQRQAAAQAAALREATTQAEVATAVAVLAAPPAGAHMRANWKARVVDPSKVPAEFWVIDTARLGELARAAKSAEAAPPGVEFYNDPTVVVR